MTTDGPAGHDRGGVSLQAVWAGYGEPGPENAVLRGLSLDLPAGTRLGILGDSGSGKSTALAVLAGLHDPWHGRVWMDGADVTDLRAFERPSNLVFQDGALFPFRTAAANIRFGPETQGRAGWAGPQGLDRAADELAAWGLQGIGDRRPGTLSGGQQQRVALLRALVNQPQVLLLDEPFRGLDEPTRRELVEVMRRSARLARQTLVLATHDIDEIFPLVDRVAVIEAGIISQLGTPAEVYRKPATVGAMRLSGDVVPLDRSALAAGPAALPAGDLWARPEALRLRARDGERPSTGELVLTGRLAWVAGGGVHRLFDVALDSGRHLTWRGPGEVDLPVGAEVEIAVPADAVLAPPAQPRDPPSAWAAWTAEHSAAHSAAHGAPPPATDPWTDPWDLDLGLIDRG